MTILLLHLKELVSMNKNDIILIGIIIIVSIFILFLISVREDNEKKIAVVYYQNEKIMTIDFMKKGINEYQVEGENGLIILETNNGKIRVKSENSPLHLCSKQGYISKSNEIIICLPNKIVIQIEDQNELDTVVK